MFQRTSSVFTDDDDASDASDEGGGDEEDEEDDDKKSLSAGPKSSKASGGETGASSSSSTSSVPMTSLERLIRAHPIWFLPQVQRDEVTELLHGKETGVIPTRAKGSSTRQHNVPKILGRILSRMK